MKFEEKIIVALDMQNQKSLDHFLQQMQGNLKYVKIGMELFYTFGPDIIRRLKEMKLKVFVDLKIHDIPNTAFRAIKTLTAHGVDMLNVHAIGGKKMLEFARKGLQEALLENSKLTPPLLIAVTHLTSMAQEDLAELGIEEKLDQSILSLAGLALQAKLDGVVCSSHEVSLLKNTFDKNFITVTPGIRLKEDERADQKRVMTPKEAFLQGSDYIVIGRSITNANDPREKFQRILEELYAN